MSRETILAAIRKHKPATIEAVTLPQDVLSSPDKILSTFRDSLEKAGGTSHLVGKIEDARDCINKQYPDRQDTYSQIAGMVDDSVDISSYTQPHQLQAIDLAILKGEFGVAENAAVWVSDTNLVYRAICFIAQQLVLIICQKDLVENMHHAYAQVSFKDSGFGCFIAGPSKTADIEQSLVIGAHGARGLTVYIVENM